MDREQLREVLSKTVVKPSPMMAHWDLSRKINEPKLIGKDNHGCVPFKTGNEKIEDVWRLDWTVKPTTTLKEHMAHETILDENGIVTEIPSVNKYNKGIHDVNGNYIGVVDVYSVLTAFKPGHCALDHAIKKLLAPGRRGKGDYEQDLKEAINSIQRALNDYQQSAKKN